MKYVTIALILFMSMGIQAQDTSEKRPFVRVFDEAGQRIAKGNINAMTNTTMTLNKNGNTVTIAVSDIGTIKTKRGAGKSALIGGTIGLAAGALIGGAAAQDDGILGIGKGAGAAVGGLALGGAGALIGGLTGAAKNSQTYVINGDEAKWRAFKEHYE